MKYKEEFIKAMVEEIASASEDGSFFETTEIRGKELFKEMDARAMYMSFEAGMDFRDKY